MNQQQNRNRLASILRQHDLKVVFAESCTGGLVAATLAQVSGISQFLCGSAVTYRPATKRQWLSISTAIMDEHSCESEHVCSAMASAVLNTTPEAGWSAAVVGHLEPTEGPAFVWINIARRETSGEVSAVGSHSETLTTSTRVDRQQEAVGLVLQRLADAIESHVSR